MNPSLIFFGGFSLYLVFLFVIGFVPSFFIFNKRDTSLSQIFSFILFSSITGFLVLNLSVLHFALLIGIGSHILSLFFAALYLSITLFLIGKSLDIRHFFWACFKKAWFLWVLIFLVFFPLATYPVFYLAMKEGFFAGYAIGNDGAAYLAAVENIKKIPWSISAPGLVFLRPLMQYAMGATSSILNVSPHHAYAITAALITFFISSSVALLSFSIFSFEKLSSRIFSFLLIALGVGLGGCYSTLYFTGTMSQYFGAMPVFASFLFLQVEEKIWKKALWFYISMVASLTMYTIGYIIIPVVLISSYFVLLIAKQIFAKDSYKKNVGYLLLFWAVTAFVVAIFNYELAVVFQWAGTRNHNLHVGYLSTLIMDFGLHSKYMGVENISPYLFWAIGILFLQSFLLLFKIELQYIPFVLAPLAISGVVFVADPNNLFLTKYGCLLYSLLLLSVVSFMSFNKIRSWLLALALIPSLFLILRNGELLTTGFYLSVMKGRHIYVDSHIESLKAKFKELGGSRILAAEFSGERNPFLKTTFYEFEWQPAKNLSTWPDYSYTAKNYPKEFDQYNYDFVLVDFENKGPVDLESGNEKYLIATEESLGLKAYGRGASFVDLDLNFESFKSITISKNPTQSKTIVVSRALDSQMFFANHGKHAFLKIDYELLGENRKDLKITSNGIDVPVNNISSKGIVNLDCKIYCDRNVNDIHMLTSDPQGLVINNISFGY